MMLPDLPSFGATACHSSSVTNGISGCSIRSSASSTYSKVWRVESAASASSPLSAGFASSTNQSQNWFQANSYRHCASRSKRYSAKWPAASAQVRSSWARIHFSASVTGEGLPPSALRASPPASGGRDSGIFISAKRVAFHSLLQKFL